MKEIHKESPQTGQPVNWHSQAVVVTGSSGSGKSLVSSLLKEFGAVVISADELARAALAPGSPILEQIREAFGCSIFMDGCLDRQALGRLVFSNPKLRERLESLTHPRIAELAQQKFAELSQSNPKLIVYDCPLFFETSLKDKPFRAVILVTAPEETKIERLIKRDGITREDALKRLANQLPDSDKIPHSDFVVTNDGSLEELREKVKKLVEVVI